MNYEIHQYDHSSEIVKADINEFWFCHVEKGSATILFEEKKYKLPTDTVFIVQEGARFKMLSSSRDMKMECFVFYDSVMNIVYPLLGAEADFGELDMTFWDDQRLGKPYGYILSREYELLRFVIELPDLIARNKMIIASLTHLLLVVYNAMGTPKKPFQSDNSKRSRQLLNRFYELITTNTHIGHRDNRFYAEKLCISERYLFKVCKKETGKTPKELIHQILISQIKNSLLITEMTLQQLADRYHFPDQSAFGQFFKRQEGISPSEFRRKYK
ncbi:MAG: helix-turn-helix transcriptional regulator [Bacteroidales bacterium]|nr:helix-turn-helix transcriptional regulator [Bacteroidales bacterium]